MEQALAEDDHDQVGHLSGDPAEANAVGRRSGCHLSDKQLLRFMSAGVIGSKLSSGSR